MRHTRQTRAEVSPGLRAIIHRSLKSLFCLLHPHRRAINFYNSNSFDSCRENSQFKRSNASLFPVHGGEFLS
jgi:hypothetical protein